MNIIEPFVKLCRNNTIIVLCYEDRGERRISYILNDIIMQQLNNGTLIYFCGNPSVIDGIAIYTDLFIRYRKINDVWQLQLANKLPSGMLSTKIVEGISITTDELYYVIKNWIS